MTKKINTVQQSLAVAFGAKAKEIYELYKEGYTIEEISKKISPLTFPPKLAQSLKEKQQKRFQREQFNRRHSTSDIRTFLRHLFKTLPEDPRVQEWVDRVKMPMLYLKDMVKMQAIEDFRLDLSCVENGEMDIAVKCGQHTDEHQIALIIDKAMNSKLC